MVVGRKAVEAVANQIKMGLPYRSAAHLRKRHIPVHVMLPFPTEACLLRRERPLHIANPMLRNISTCFRSKSLLHLQHASCLR